MSSHSPFLFPSLVPSPDSLAVLHLKRDLLTPTILRTYDDENIGYAEGKVTTTRYGNYPHSTLIGQPWGSQIKASQVDTGTRGRVGPQICRGSKRKRGGSSTSHGDDVAVTGENPIGPAQEAEVSESKDVKAPIPAATGFCHLLPPTPEVWTASLPHRTQVVYTPDYSYILQRLRVTPGTEVIEAGAGSGSFSHAAARAVFNGYPTHELSNGAHALHEEGIETGTGRVWSFEFHDQRAQKLQAEIQEHGLQGIVRVTHRDVYQDGFSIGDTSFSSQINASAVFLDLPAPWLALRHLTRNRPSPLNPSTSVHLCTFSPCIEQVQRTVSALRAFGWLDVEMVEISAHRIECRRERVGLQEEGLRGVNATPATVDEAVGRLREVEGRDRSYRHGLTVKALNESLGAAESMDGSEDGKPKAEEEFTSKQQRLQLIKDAQASRKLYKEGRLVHRSEPELKMHTSYLVFAVLPRPWTYQDERDAQQAFRQGVSQVSAEGPVQPMSKRQRKRAAKELAGGDKHAEMEMKWQVDDEEDK
ncbi:MAG: hypothetical protein L6R41_002273 [Letrouitia leprolyta]|nr:MAG: hypothetical protein L6R41_002273 [Letrouitia leprolyta]